MVERPPFHRSLLLLGLASAWSGLAEAGEWTITPRVEIEQTYSDNILLRDKDKEDDFVTAVNPGINIRGEGRQFEASLDYTMENLAYANHEEFNQTNHQLAAKSKLVIVPEYFFFDGSADIGQRAVSLDNVRYLDNLNITNNRVDYEYFNLTPYFAHNFGGWVVTDLRYSAFRYDDSFQESGDDLSNFDTGGDGNSIRALIGSGEEFTRLQWNLNFERYTQDSVQGLAANNTAQVGKDVRESSMAMVTYSFSPAWSAIVRGGEQNNEIGGIERSNNGSFSAAGVGWSPSRKFSMRVLSGSTDREVMFTLTPTERTNAELSWRDLDVGTVAGPTWNVKAAHKTRNTDWKASYEKSLVSQQQLILQGREPRIIIDPQTGRPRIINAPIYGLDNETFLREYGAFNVSYTLGRNKLNTRIYHEKRNYELNPEHDEKVLGTNFGVDFGLAAHSVLAVELDWDQREFLNLDRDEDFYTLRSRWTYTLSPKSKFELSLAHTVREDNGDDAAIFLGESLEYVENRVMARLSKDF